MGIYSNRIFPWVIEHVMSREVMTHEREKLVPAAEGDVLEIGFGTGLNLPHYSAAVTRLTVLDPNSGMHRRAAERIAAAKMPVEAIQLGAEDRLPVDDGRFDTIVSTWTMCSIPDLAGALRELARVLKPGGKLLFLEHGLSPDANIARWQNRLNPLNRRIGDGCNLNRDMTAIIGASPLVVESCDQFYLPKTPRIGGWMYRGVALRPPN